MLSRNDILETIRMIDQQHLDIRTITMGISLRDLASDDVNVLADKIYRNRENLSYCKLHGIRLSGPALGRPRRDEQRDRRQTHFDQNERIEVERQFSFAKRKCNLGKVKTKLAETVGFTLAMSIVVLNLRKIQHTLSRLFGRILHFLLPQQKLVFVQ